MFFIRDDYCFACGPNNPIGLKLKIEKTPKGAKAIFYPHLNYQGFKGILHGGIISTLLDEVMVWAFFLRDIPCVTAELQVVFKKPIKIQEPILIEAEIIEIREKWGRAISWIIQKDSKVSEGRGKFYFINESGFI